MFKSSIFGLTTSGLMEVMENCVPENCDLYIDAGDGQLSAVEMIKGDEVNGKPAVILRAFM